MWTVYQIDNPRTGEGFKRIDGTPGWVTRAALTAAGLIILLPIVLLVLAAVLAGLLVFAVLVTTLRLMIACRRVWWRLRGALGYPAPGYRSPGYADFTGSGDGAGRGRAGGGDAKPFWADDGRRNVRVIRNER
jgi:hypothetical protein